MPNHTANVLVVEGPGAVSALTRYLTRLKSKKEDPERKFRDLDLEKIKPMPKVLHEVATGGVTIDGKQYDRWMEKKMPDGKIVNLPIPQETLEKWRKQYGALDWHQWAIANWGTKWNTYDGCVIEVRGKDWIEIFYQTAWSPPDPALDTLAAQLPAGFKMLALASDEGGGFVTMRVSSEGNDWFSEIALGEDCWNSPEGRIVRRKLGSDGGRRPPRSFKVPHDTWEWSTLVGLQDL